MEFYGQAETTGLSTFTIEVKQAPSLTDAIAFLKSVVAMEFGEIAGAELEQRGFSKKLVPAHCGMGWPEHLRDYIEKRQAKMHDMSSVEFVWCGIGRYMFWGVTRYPRINPGPIKPQPEAI